MDGPLHLVTVEVVGTSEDDGAGSPGLGSLDEDQLVVTDPLLADLCGLSEVAGLEALLSLNVGEAGDEGGPSGLGNPLEVHLLAPSIFTFLYKYKSELAPFPNELDW